MQLLKAKCECVFITSYVKISYRAKHLRLETGNKALIKTSKINKQASKKKSPGGNKWYLEGKTEKVSTIGKRPKMKRMETGPKQKHVTNKSS